MRASWSLRIASARPPEKAPSERDHQASGHGKRSRPFVPRDQNRPNPTDQPHAAASAEIDVPREQHEKHADREHRGDRELDHEQREIARAQEVRRCSGEEAAEQQQIQQEDGFATE